MQQDRFKDAPWFSMAQGVQCIIGGSGGIGSWVAFFLARIGYQIHIYDFDTVEEHNLGGQLFMHNAVGKPKVEAIKESIAKFNFYSNVFYSYNESIEEFSPRAYHLPTIFISCFDNMKARQIMFNKYTEQLSRYSDDDMSKPIFIDGRLLMEQLDIFFLNNQKRNLHYAEHQLFDDSEVEELPCSMKQTSHSAAMIASHMVSMITNHTSNLAWGQEIISNPYHYQFIIPTQVTSYVK